MLVKLMTGTFVHVCDISSWLLATKLHNIVVFCKNVASVVMNIKHYPLIVYVVVKFISGNFSFSFVSTSLAYITIPQNKTKTKIT